MIPAFFKMVFQLSFMGAAPFSENDAVSRYAAVLSTDGSIIALIGEKCGICPRMEGNGA